MTFKDLLEGTDLLGSELSVINIGAALLLSFTLGLFIFWVYKRSYQGVMYSKTFNISLVALSMITSSVILAITSNIILSLGMVGALSIVRFRTAIKDPIDVIYMFWSISAGIIAGAGLYVLAIITSLTIGLVLYIFSKINIKHEPYLLIVNYGSSEDEDQLFKLINEKVGTYKVKSKTRSQEQYELTIELRSGKELTKLVDNINELKTVTHSAMISYDGEYAA
ncbi:MAG: DUF4956 domain-containing protein [Clostridiales bacterium]